MISGCHQKSRGKVISGVVLLGDGKPAEGARVQITKLPEYGFVGMDPRADASGHFSFTAMEGLDYSIVAIGIGERPLKSDELHFSLRKSRRQIVLVLNRQD